MADILDTSFEGKEFELKTNRVVVGDDVNIMVKDQTLKKLLIGVGWDLQAFDVGALDLDVSVFLVDKNGKTPTDQDFVFYNNKETPDGGVRHNGDSRTSAGDGDDESIFIDLHKIPFDVMRIIFILSIYRGEEKTQSLGMAKNTYIRVANFETEMEILRYSMDKDMHERPETGLLAASLNREGPKWHFTPVAEFVQGGLAVFAKRYGIVLTHQ